MKYLFRILGYLFIAIVIYPSNYGRLKHIQFYIIGPTTTHKNIYVPPNFDDKEFLLIQIAAEDWHVKTGGRASFNVIRKVNEYYDDTSSETIYALKLSSKDPNTAVYDERLGSKMLGFYDTINGVHLLIVVSDRMTDDEYYAGVIRHEIGHSLGLEHNLLPNTLMYPWMTDSSRYITPTDVGEFCKIYYCTAPKKG